MTYAYGCTHSEHGGAPRTKVKVPEAVKTLIRRLNTCFRLVKKRFPVVAYENIAIRMANALGLPCFTVSKASNESSSGMIYVLVLCISATIFRVNITPKKNNIRTKIIKSRVDN